MHHPTIHGWRKGRQLNLSDVQPIVGLQQKQKGVAAGKKKGWGVGVSFLPPQGR